MSRLFQDLIDSKKEKKFSESIFCCEWKVWWQVLSKLMFILYLTASKLNWTQILITFTLVSCRKNHKTLLFANPKLHWASFSRPFIWSERDLERLSHYHCQARAQPKIIECSAIANCYLKDPNLYIVFRHEISWFSRAHCTAPRKTIGKRSYRMS